MSEIEDKDKIVDVASEPAVSYALNDCLNSETEIDYEFHGRDFGYAKTLVIWREKASLIHYYDIESDTVCPPVLQTFPQGINKR
jgi:hypothetical protein